MKASRVAGLLSLAALLAACNTAPDGSAAAEKPAAVSVIKGTTLKRVTLSAKAAERLGIQTALVRVRKNGTRASLGVVPYSSLIYDPTGETALYTNPEPLSFVKQAVTVDHISGDAVYLSAGPRTGTRIVTVGSAELFGVEFGIGVFE